MQAQARRDKQGQVRDGQLDSGYRAGDSEGEEENQGGAGEDQQAEGNRKLESQADQGGQEKPERQCPDINGLEHEVSCVGRDHNTQAGRAD